MSLNQILAGNVIYADDIQDEIDFLTALTVEATDNPGAFARSVNFPPAWDPCDSPATHNQVVLTPPGAVFDFM